MDNPKKPEVDERDLPPSARTRSRSASAQPSDAICKGDSGEKAARGAKKVKANLMPIPLMAQQKAIQENPDLENVSHNDGVKQNGAKQKTSKPKTAKEKSDKETVDSKNASYDKDVKQNDVNQNYVKQKAIKESPNPENGALEKSGKKSADAEKVAKKKAGKKHSNTENGVTENEALGSNSQPAPDTAPGESGQHLPADHPPTPGTTQRNGRGARRGNRGRACGRPRGSSTQSTPRPDSTRDATSNSPQVPAESLAEVSTPARAEALAQAALALTQSPSATPAKASTPATAQAITPPTTLVLVASTPAPTQVPAVTTAQVSTHTTATVPVAPAEAPIQGSTDALAQVVLQASTRGPAPAAPILAQAPGVVPGVILTPATPQLHSPAPLRALAPAPEALRLNQELRVNVLRLPDMWRFVQEFAHAEETPHIEELRLIVLGDQFNERSRHIFIQQDPALLASLMFPDANHESLRIATFFLLWQDVWHADGKGIIAFAPPNPYYKFREGMVAYIGRALQLENHGGITAIDGGFITKFLDPVMDIVLSTSDPVQRSNFVDCISQYLDFVHREHQIFRDCKVPTYREYQSARLDHDHIQPLIELMCIVLRLDIHHDILNRHDCPEWEVLLNTLGLILSYIRDLFHVKEDLDADTWTCNIVMIEFQQCRHLSVATQRVLGRLSSAITTFKQLRGQLFVRFDPDQAKLGHVHRVVVSLEKMISGYLLWALRVPFLNIQRYTVAGNQVAIPLDG